MLADDHEFWNDYPHGNIWLTWGESSPTGPLGKRIDSAFTLFQSALNLDAAQLIADPKHHDLLPAEGRTFRFRLDPLSFFVLDVRTRRSRYDVDRAGFAPRYWLDDALDWARTWNGPAVLAVSQPMVERRNSLLSRVGHVMADVNLPDYDDGYAALWEALLNRKHDTVVLTGDIHWSRSYVITRPQRSKPRVWEITSSPLARIPGGPGSVGSSRGQVQWLRGRADYHAHYATNVNSTYTTISFKRTGTGVDAVSRVWSASAQPGMGPTLVHQAQLSLE
jgi:phosphodiesterase/alkaline phosphatase D-like protein